MRISEDQMVGIAGQYVTCADLMTKGIIAYPACEGLPYDVVIDRGSLLLKVQVKTCRRSKQPGVNKKYGGWYSFNLTAPSGKKGKGKVASLHKYKSDEVDIFALVALDTKQVGYLLRWDVKQMAVRFRDDNRRGEYYSDYQNVKYTKVCSMHEKGISFDDISKKLNIPIATAKDIVRHGLHEKKAVYFSSIQRDADWFWNIEMPLSWGMGIKRKIYGA